jgi:hypothetical protein
MNPSNVNRKLAVAQRSQPTPQAGKNGRQALMALEGMRWPTKRLTGRQAQCLIEAKRYPPGEQESEARSWPAGQWVSTHPSEV